MAEKKKEVKTKVNKTVKVEKKSKEVVKKKEELPSLFKKELATFVGETISTCFGVIGLVDYNSSLNNILKKDNYIKGVNIESIASLKKYDINVHIQIAYGLRVNEVMNEVMKRLEYFITQKYGKIYRKINVYVEDLKII